MQFFVLQAAKGVVWWWVVVVVVDLLEGRVISGRRCLLDQRKDSTCGYAALTADRPATGPTDQNGIRNFTSYFTHQSNKKE